jgi:uncharacterized protein YndB with AHSA1/START domain
MNADLAFEEYFETTIESLWAAIATSAALAEWLMPNDFEPKVGHRFEFRCEGHGRGRIESEVLECSPPRRLVFTWIDNDDGEPMRVEIDLRQQGSGTLLSLRHTGPTEPSNASSLESGWPVKFAHLRVLIARSRS